ncbi:MAG: glucose-1-phosphate thymidylyltransferase RfbA, partial [Lachnospiraceae bacterium]|nr:glucose-1-phosphate thymidylyltransferase RfbA [Lachnospiraceae bacterium]
YYPLSTLMLAGIKDVLIISTPRDLPVFEELFKDGSQLGMNFSYAVQEYPRGLADAFIIGDKFIGNDACALVLGDNIFYGQSFTKVLKEAADRTESQPGATIFGYYVRDPREYGVVEFDENGKAISIEEKPEKPKSNYAVPGLYFYDNDVVDIAKNVKPSARGEIEITSINNEYLNRGTLFVETMGRGFSWLDTGNHDALLDAANFVETIQKRQGLYVSCIEEIAFKKGFIGKEELLKLAEPLMKTAYGKYLTEVANGL